MEATKKTSVTRAALLVLAALSMLLSGLFIATASRSDASPPQECPAGFNLTLDAKNCYQAAVVTSADNPNSCAEGQLTPDGTTCYVAARIIPQQGQTLCPKGYSPDDSLGAMCARFEPATQNLPGCPEGARGVAGACYILVAKGPRGAITCPIGQTLAGTTCVITGTAPVNGVSTCPVSATVLQDATGFCYTLVSPTTTPGTCFGGYAMIANRCKIVADGTTTFVCPQPTGATYTTETVQHPDGTVKIAFCIQAPAGATSCPVDLPRDTNGVDCRQRVTLVPGAPQCVNGYGLVGGKCIRYDSPAVPAPQCPSGSVEDSVGDCRKPVADAAGTYYCKDASAALNGKSCVFTTGFLINPAPTLYKCDKGVRTVIGSGSGTLVLCLLGPADANTTTGPSCLQGVLSTDNLYCIVPRIDTAPAGGTTAPVPAFTG